MKLNNNKRTGIFYMGLSILAIVAKVRNVFVNLYNKVDTWAYFKCFIPWIKARVESGDGILFTNVRYLIGDGEITHQDFTKTFVIDKKAMLLNSDQGPIFLIHGNPNGKVYTSQTGEREIFEDSILAMVPPGEYWLVSCFNGTRADIAGIEVGGRIFYPVVCTEYMLHGGYDANTKNMYVASCTKEFHKLVGAPIAKLSK